MPAEAEPILSVRDLRTWFLTDAGVVRAVDGVSFDHRPGQTLGNVRENRIGKIVCANSIMRLLDPPRRALSAAASCSRRPRPCETRRRTNPRHPRPRDRHGVPGSHDLAEPGAADRQADRRGDDGAWQVQTRGSGSPRDRPVAAYGSFRTGTRRAFVSAPSIPRYAPARHDAGDMGSSTNPALADLLDEPTTALDVTIQAQTRSRCYAG